MQDFKWQSTIHLHGLLLSIIVVCLLLDAREPSKDYPGQEGDASSRPLRTQKREVVENERSNLVLKFKGFLLIIQANGQRLTAINVS